MTDPRPLQLVQGRDGELAAPRRQRSSHMWCECVTDFSRLESLSGEWPQWTSFEGQPNIFQQWAWVRAFWNAYHHIFSLCCLVVREEKQVVGILPLVQRGGTIQFLGSPDSDCNDILCEDGMAAEVLEVALESLLQLPFDWRSGLLQNLPSNSRIIRSIPCLPLRIRRHLQLVYRWPSPTIFLDQNRQEDLKVLIDKMRKHHHKKLPGRVSFRHLETREQVREHLNGFFRQHIARWAMCGTRSQFLQPEKRAFYEALVEEFDPCTHLRFSVLEHNSRPIAYNLGFQIRGRFIMYTPTFDVNYWDYAPGHLLLSHLFHYALDAELSEFDFSIGDELYKYRFANHVRKTYVLHLERNPLAVRSCFNSVVRHVEHVVRQKPSWQAAVKTGLGSLHSLRKRFRIMVQDFTQMTRLPEKLCRTIWLRDEVRLYASSNRIAGRTPKVEIARETLAGLVSLLAEYPDGLDDARLREYRQRLKKGDQVFVARVSGREVYVLWVGRRNEISVREIGPACRIPFQEPVAVLYESWKAPKPRARAVTAEILCALSELLGGTKYWIYATALDRTKLKAVEDAGFLLERRLQYHAFLRRFRRTSVVSVAEMDAARRATAGVLL